MKKFKCQICGKEFEAYSYDYGYGERKYCSRACYEDARRKTRPPCIVCGIEITGSRTKYCTMRCRTIAWKGRKRPDLKKRFNKQCESCGKTFEVGGRAAHPWNRFCSRQCSGVSKRKPLGESTSDNNHAWRELRQKVLARDGYRCAFCGGGNRLQAHHLIPRKNGGTHDMDNLAMACAHCHGALDRVCVLLEKKGRLEAFVELLR